MDIKTSTCIALMEYESDSEMIEGTVGTAEAINSLWMYYTGHAGHPRTFYLQGKLASEIPQDDKQLSASLYRAVCGGDLATVKSLLEGGHDPNLPYYYIPKKVIVSNLYNYDRDDLGENIEGERGMFHAPLHRAVLLNNLELVELLLDHGADPNTIDGRSNTPLTVLIKSKNLIDSVIVEKLVAWGADKNAALHIACQGEYEWRLGPKIKWPVVKTLLRHGADVKKSLMQSEHSFINVITQCGRGEDMETSYEILGEFLKSGLDASLLKKAFEKTLLSFMCARSDTVRKLAHLVEVGVPFDYAIEERGGFDHQVDGHGYTPLHLLLDRLEESAMDISGRSRCRKLLTELLCVDFSWVWILVKAGAQFKLCNGGDIGTKLWHLDSVLNNISENVQFYPQESSPDRRSVDVVLGHLQHCKEVMTWLGSAHPRSLFALSAVAVRRSLGFYPGRKLKNMGVPQLLQDAILLKDMWPFVEKAERRLFLHRDEWSTDSEDDFSSSDDLGMNSSGDEDDFLG